jgi:rhodanese-related sulfurtransferase
MDQVIEFIGNHWILSGIWVFLAAALIGNLLKASGKTPTLSSQQAVDLVNREDAMVVDIRSASEFAKGHIINSLNIPSAKADESHPKLEKQKQNPIILVCNTGMSVSAVATKLVTSGFERVYKLSGGIQGWQGDNLPLTKK